MPGEWKPPSTAEPRGWDLTQLPQQGHCAQAGKAINENNQTGTLTGPRQRGEQQQERYEGLWIRARGKQTDKKID